jgi:hypothetical protein
LAWESRPLPDTPQTLTLAVGIGGRGDNSRNDKPLASEFDESVFEAVRGRHEIIADAIGVRPFYERRVHRTTISP